MRFKFYKSLKEFLAENPKHFSSPTLRKNPHFFDIECKHLILDGESLTIVTRSTVVIIDKWFIAHVIPRAENPNPDGEYLKKDKENLLMGLGLCLS